MMAPRITVLLAIAVGALFYFGTAHAQVKEKELRDLEAEVDQYKYEEEQRAWDEMERQHERKMQEIQAETDRNLEATRDSQRIRLLALKLTIDQIRARQPAAKSALLHFINGYAKFTHEMEKPEAARSVQIVRQGLVENDQGMKELRDLPITPLPTEDRTIMLVCYGESKPGARERELKSLVNSLWHARWRFEKRDSYTLFENHGAGIWIVQGKIYL
jgi:hypothetical protein